MTEIQPATGEAIPSRLFITGATGFVGSGIMRALGRTPGNPPSGPFAGMEIQSLVRKPGSSLEGVLPVVGDVTDPGSLTGKFEGVDTVVHLVAIIEEDGGATFDQVIRQGTENVLSEAARAGVGHFILMSALGAHDNPEYPYHQAKFRAEQAVKASGLPFTIFRPSVIFGEGDGFITVLAGLVKSFPIVPVVGSGESKFQPVQLDDVSSAFAYVVAHPGEAAGQTYELGGAKPYTYEQMLDAIASELGKKKPKIHMPVGLMKVVVSATSPLPGALRPPVTMEQLKMLALDNSTEHSATERLIGRKPVALEDGIGYIRNG
jgi:NADH dehydrogenase